MQSSVVESSSSPRLEVRGQRYQPQYEPHVPDPHRSNGKPEPSKRHLALAPAEGWFALVLLAVAMYCVVFSIISVGWVSHTFILYWSAGAGLIVGLGIAKLRSLPQAILHLAACLIGHWLSVWLTSAVAFHVSWHLLVAGIGAIITDPTRINSGEMVFLFYLSFLCFFLGYFGTWLAYRAHLPWLVAIVYCSILLINLNYVKHDLSLTVAVLLAALILLIARIQLTAQLAQWKSEGLYTDRSWLQGITRRFIQIASVIVVLTLLIGWLFPVLNQTNAGANFWNELNNAWSNISQNPLSWRDPGALLQPYQAPTNFFGDQLTIAGSVNLPTGEVLNYTSSAAPQYLAGFSYDHFDGHTWTSLSSVNRQDYEADAALPNDTAHNYTRATTSVTLVLPPAGPKHYIFGPAQPASFDVAITVYGNPIVSAWAQRSAMTNGEHYQVTSFISTASSQDLSAVSLPQDNPAMWKGDGNYSTLQAYYLQVPAGLSPQVRKTAQQWTQGAANTYDVLKRLEAHLSDQAQFTYAVDNPPVPGNVDAVSWLLQTRRGYCTYYATAMTIMARQLGIPARIVNGFSHGHLDNQRKVWVVDGSDAHSWVQAYFPGFGWINFDPTPGYALNSGNNPRPAMSPVPTPQPTRPAATATPTTTKKNTHPSSPPHAEGDPGAPGAASQQSMLLDLSMVVLLCSILVFLAALARYWWRGHSANSTFITRTFWRLCRIASWAGLSPQPWQTPYEYSRVLCSRVPQEATPLWRLTELFVRERWSAPHQIPYALEMSERELQRLWPGLRRMFLRLLWMKTKIKR
ncbi:MAG: transglutaminase domain-containing protein [Chloroflexi bacterium]|nr:MAG: transglutaminase domain-containing protein [Chloroflexota bacterium]